MGEVTKGMERKGLSVNNTADAFAAYWTAAWQATRADTEEKSNAAYAAVSRQAARGLLSSPEFTAASDAQKQEMAEALLKQMVIMEIANEQASSDILPAKDVQRAILQGAKASGLDLEAITFTEEGFVKA